MNYLLSVMVIVCTVGLIQNAMGTSYVVPTSYIVPTKTLYYEKSVTPLYVRNLDHYVVTYPRYERTYPTYKLTPHVEYTPSITSHYVPGQHEITEHTEKVSHLIDHGMGISSLQNKHSYDKTETITPGHIESRLTYSKMFKYGYDRVY